VALLLTFVAPDVHSAGLPPGAPGVEGGVVALVELQAKQPGRRQGRETARCRELRNRCISLKNHYALLCLTLHYPNKRPWSAVALTSSAILNEDDEHAVSGSLIHQQGARMPLKHPVTFSASSGRVVQDFNGNFNLSR
jgi:hypothetical protein